MGSVLTFLWFAGIILANGEEFEIPGPPSFRWRNCNTTYVPITITTMDVSPFPLTPNGSLTVSAGIQLHEDLVIENRPIEGIINVTGKLDICLLLPKTCHVDDLCQFLDEKDVVTCPTFFGPFNLRFRNVTIGMPNLPTGAVGPFNVTARLRQQGRELGCLNLFLCLRTCSPIPEVSVQETPLNDDF